MVNLPSNKVLLVIIICVASILRFINIENTSLSNDELSLITSVYELESFTDVFSEEVRANGHTGLTAFLVFCFGGLFGFTANVLKIPFILFGIGAVYVLYKCGKEWFDEYTGLFASAFLAVLEFGIINSQIIRPYSFGLFFYLLFLLFWIKIVVNKQINNTNILLSALFCAIAASIHYFNSLACITTYLAGFLVLSKPNWLRYIAISVLSLIFWSPNLMVFAKQLNAESSQLISNAAHWLPMPAPTYFFEYIGHIFGNSWIWLVFFTLLFSLKLIFNRRIEVNKSIFIAALIFITPYIVGHLYSVTFRPILQFRYLYFTFPLLLLALGYYCITTIPSKKYYTISIMTILVIGCISIAFTNDFYHKEHFGVFKPLIAKHIHHNEQYGGNKIMHIANINNSEYYRFYQKDRKHPIKFNFTKINHGPDFGSLDSLIRSSDKKYCAFSWSSRSTHPEIYDIIMEKYPRIVFQQAHFNSAYTLFQRDSIIRTPILLWKNAYYQTKKEFHWSDSFPKYDTLYYTSPPYSELLTTENTYSCSFKLKLNELNYHFDSVYISVKVKAKASNNSKATLVLDFKEKEKSIDWYGNDFSFYQPNDSGWKTIYASRNIPRNATENTTLNVYVWNRTNQELRLDDFQVTVYQKTSIPFQ